jgi:hypothetical protein
MADGYGDRYAGARDRDPDERERDREARRRRTGRGAGEGEPGAAAERSEPGPGGEGSRQRQPRRGGDRWGFGPWPGGRHMEEEWRQWGVEPETPGWGGSGKGWLTWGGFGPGYDREPWERRHGGAVRREGYAVPGPHAGRGPRGYQRSDDRIKEDVCERMAEHGQLDASDIEVRVASGEVTLEGSVDSRWAKRLAEDLAEDVPGVRDVHNRLRVAAPGQPGPQGERPHAA